MKEMGRTYRAARIEVRAGIWEEGTESVELLRVYRVWRPGAAELIGVIEYSDARALADALHDACDAFEVRQK